jgi:hypothetical protein
MKAKYDRQPHVVLEAPDCNKPSRKPQSSFGQFIFNFSCWLMVFGILLVSSSACAQSYEKLNQLKGYNTATYFSAGADVKAGRMAKQLDRVMSFYDQHLGFTPSVTLLILSPQDWNHYTKFPFYGMPHYTGDKTLVVASEDNAYWKSMQPPPDKIPTEQRQVFAQTYLNQNDEMTMEPFFDLLTIHELGHAYQSQGGLVMQRRWMGELFCNILLHSYIAETEPQLLHALTVFPEMVVATTDRSSLKYTTLEELEIHYNDIGPNHPQNYGWYQCRWHVAAGKIYDSSKMQGIKNLWSVLKSQKEVLDDRAFVDLLNAKVHPSVADVPKKWDED